MPHPTDNSEEEVHSTTLYSAAFSPDENERSVSDIKTLVRILNHIFFLRSFSIRESKF